ncbi:MAG: hypothetical protein IKS96_07205 [Fibrobacter sp.]|nr:hypothetical protein [Fibrobacter sp.]MBR6449715.1 hypothetical protein [Fibrobacter sp.]
MNRHELNVKYCLCDDSTVAEVLNEVIRLGLDKSYASRIVPTYGNFIEKNKAKGAKSIAKEIYKKESAVWTRLKGAKGNGKPQRMLAPGIPLLGPLKMGK